MVASMPELPTGTVTFLFTDIEGSTRVLNALGDAYPAVLDRHHALLREAFDAHGGLEVMSEGDAFFVVFRSPIEAVRAATDAQQALSAEDWPPGARIGVRMGVHTGEAVLGGDNYVGIDVHRASRIAAAGHGGQVLLSDATRALSEQSLPPGVSVRDLGPHRLKDLPAPERLFQVVVAGLPSDFPELRSLDARPNNLPAPLTSFVGRERVLGEIRERLARTRLLTLSGPGGTGKTRLAIRVAEDSLTDFAHGCWFVPLDALRDAELVPSAIAKAVGVSVPGDQSVADTLKSWLADRELLLVLDNFEQVTSSAPLVGELLAAAPRLRVLATSRAPLHVYGEAEYAVPPLATVGELRAAAGSPQALSQYEAVRLFIERAVAVKRDFKVTNANAPAVAEICVRLDGLPLAIELAAARVKVLPAEQILERLERNLSLLATSAQNLPERQRTMRGAIEWSYNLLDPAEQQLFGRVSVFRGGFGLDASDYVCAVGIDSDVLDGLTSLVDKSLLRADESAGESRFVMLETIRQYAAERLAETDEAGEIRRRHAEHYFALAEASEAHLTGHAQADWLDRLEREHDNLRAAFSSADDLGLVDRALGAAGAIWRFWHQRGHFAEARTVLERLLALPGEPSSARAKALTGLGGIVYWQGDYDATGRRYEEAREMYETIGDRAGLAEALLNESYGPLLAGKFETGRRLIRRSIELFNQVGNELGKTNAELLLGFTYMFQAKPVEALPIVESAVAAFRRLGARWELADSLTGLGYVRAIAGDWENAMPPLFESLEIFGQAGNEVGIATVVSGIAAAAGWVGDSERSARLFGKCEEVQARLGGGPPGQFVAVSTLREKAVQALGDADFTRLAAEGAQMSTSEVLELARSFRPPPDAPPLPRPEPPPGAEL
jgi:predicted ATPase/class 3 adenylate cyclase